MSCTNKAKNRRLRQTNAWLRSCAEGSGFRTIGISSGAEVNLNTRTGLHLNWRGQTSWRGDTKAIREVLNCIDRDMRPKALVRLMKMLRLIQKLKRFTRQDSLEHDQKQGKAEFRLSSQRKK